MSLARRVSSWMSLLPPMCVRRANSISAIHAVLLVPLYDTSTNHYSYGGDDGCCCTLVAQATSKKTRKKLRKRRAEAETMNESLENYLKIIPGETISRRRRSNRNFIKKQLRNHTTNLLSQSLVTFLFSFLSHRLAPPRTKDHKAPNTLVPPPPPPPPALPVFAPAEGGSSSRRLFFFFFICC